MSAPRTKLFKRLFSSCAGKPFDFDTDVEETNFAREFNTHWLNELDILVHVFETELLPCAIQACCTSVSIDHAVVAEYFPEAAKRGGSANCECGLFLLTGLQRKLEAKGWKKFDGIRGAWGGYYKVKFSSKLLEASGNEFGYRSRPPQPMNLDEVFGRLEQLDDDSLRSLTAENTGFVFDAYWNAQLQPVVAAFQLEANGAIVKGETTVEIDNRFAKQHSPPEAFLRGSCNCDAGNFFLDGLKHHLRMLGYSGFSGIRGVWGGYYSVNLLSFKVPEADATAPAYINSMYNISAKAGGADQLGITNKTVESGPMEAMLDSASASSHASELSSMLSSSGDCFVYDTLFKTATGIFVPVQKLEQFSLVCRTDEAVARATSIQKLSGVQELVEISTDAVRFVSTQSHKIMVIKGSTPQHAPAATVRVGDSVICVSGIQRVINVEFFSSAIDAFKLSFQPDEPVEAFMPLRDTVMSKGHCHPRTHRGGRRHGYPNKPGIDIDQTSIPDTSDSFR